MDVIDTRSSGKTCAIHDAEIVEYLVGSDVLENAWVIGVCPDCWDEAGNNPPPLGYKRLTEEAAPDRGRGPSPIYGCGSPVDPGDGAAASSASLGDE